MTGDDGFYIAGGYFVARGLTPFIHFPYSQGPLLPYLLAPFVSVLGPTLLASRLFGIAFLLLTYWACLRIVEAVWPPSWPQATDLNHLKSILTLLFILYPELLGALSRTGTKESAASLCCILAVTGVALPRKKSPYGAIVAGLFTGISIAIKYTGAIAAVPVLTFLLYEGSLVEVVAYLLSTATPIAAFVLPFLLSGHFDAVKENFFATALLVDNAVKENFFATALLVDNKNPGLVSHIVQTSVVTVPALLRVAAKFQLLLLPSLAWFWLEVSNDGWRVALKRPHNLVLAAFFFMTAGTYLVVSPVMQRAYMFVPLLLIHSTISVRRLWIERPRPSPALILILLLAVLAINTTFLFPWEYNDTGFTLPSFDTVRYVPTKGLRSFCTENPHEEILYIGSFQHLLLDAGCRLSAYSVVSNAVLPLSRRYQNESARRYKFPTDALLLEMLAEREFKTIVFDRGMLDSGIDNNGTNYKAIQAAIRSRYARRDLWLFEVYTAR